MDIFDIIGPIMVGPSSSHTAGAVKIGRVSRNLMAQNIVKADIYLHGSFAATGKGHGTDRAILAGLMGMECDDEMIPRAFAIAREKGIQFSFGEVDLGDEAHPNSCQLLLTGDKGKELEIVACSVGGGRIQVREIDGLKAVFSGDYSTLIVENDDHPGVVACVTRILADNHVNIATVQLDRDSRGGHAVTVIECDQELQKDDLHYLEKQDGILKVTYFSLEEQL